MTAVFRRNWFKNLAAGLLTALGAVLFSIHQAPPVQATTLANISWASGSQVNSASGYVGDTGNTVFLTNGLVNTSYTIYWAADATGQTVNLGTCVTATLGSTCSLAITVPHATKGDWTLHADSLLDDSANTITFTVSPKLTASSPSSGNVGTSITVSGTGFASESVTAKLGSFTLGSATPASGAGSTAGDLSVTAGAPEMPKGTYAVSATGTSSGTVSSSFTFAMSPKISLSSTYGVIGASTNISGNGYAASSTITVTIDGSDTSTTTTTNSVGTFSATSYTPSGSRAGHDIGAHDASANTATAIRYVIIDPIITISADTGNVGDSITLTGTAFRPSVTVTIYYDGVATATTTTSNATNGAFSGLSFTIPASTAGAHTISARDSDSNTAPNKTFTVTPKITITSSSGNVGGNTTLTGSGFAASSVVTIKWDGTASGPTTTSSSTGAFSGQNFTIPTAVAGSHSISGTDASSNSSSNVTYTVSPAITITSASGHAGDSTSISGNGFAASSTVTVVFNGSDTSTTTTSSSTGTISSLSYTIPLTTLPGTYNIAAHDASSNTSGNKSYVVSSATTPVITLSSYSGNVADAITISGSSFSATATSATVKWDGTNTSTTCTVTLGNVSNCAFTIPAATATGHTISLIDNFAVPLTSSNQTYTISPKISVSAANAASGVSITVTGTGFAASSTCTILWDNATTASTTTSNSTGGWSRSFTIPAGHSHTISAQDASSNFSNSITNDTGNSNPSTPTNSSPANGASDVSKNPTLSASAFSDADGDSHSSSAWSLYESSTCAGTADWSASTSTNLTSVTVNSSNGTFADGLSGRTTLRAHTAYSWKVTYSDNYSGTSSASSCTSFTTTNNTPTLDSNVSTQSLTEDTNVTGAFDLDTYITDADFNDSSLTCTASNGFSATLGTMTINSNNSIDFTLSTNANGSDTIQFSCQDGGGLSVSSNAITVNVTAVNDTPTANAGSDTTVNESSGSTTLNGSASSDVETSSLNYSWVETTDSHDGCSLSAPTTGAPTLTFLDAESSYDCTYQLTVNDGTVDSTADAVVIHITADNDTPSLSSLTDQTVDEAEAIEFTITATDSDSDTAITVTDTAEDFANADLSLDALMTDHGDGTATFDWTPDYEQSGSYTLTFAADDGSTSDTQAITITVNEVNDPPTFSWELPDVSFTAGSTTLEVFDLDDYFSDEVPTQLEYAAVGASQITVNINDGAVSFTAPTSYTGQEAIVFQATDVYGSERISNPIIVTVTAIEVGDDTVLTIVTPQEGPGVVEVYDEQGTLVREVTAFPKGGARAVLGTIQGDNYIYVVKAKKGTTMHVYDFDGNLVAKRQLSDQPRRRRLITAQLTNATPGYEVITAARTDRQLYLKVFNYSLEADNMSLLASTQLGPVPRDSYHLEIQDRTVSVRNAADKVLGTWQPFRSISVISDLVLWRAVFLGINIAYIPTGHLLLRQVGLSDD